MIRTVVVADAPDAMGEGPGKLLSLRLDFAGELPSATLLGFYAKRASMEVLEAAAAALLDEQVETVIALGIHVARAFGAPANLPPLRWCPLPLGARVAWTPPPRSSWWTTDRTEQARRWFMALFDVPDERAGVMIAPLADPLPHPERISPTLELRRRAVRCLTAALAVTGARRSVVLGRRTSQPHASATWKLAAYLANVNDVPSEMMAGVLQTTGGLVRNDAYRFRVACAGDRALVALAVQGEQAYELIEHLEFLRHLDKRSEEASVAAGG